jgi:hypothetical protein
MCPVQNITCVSRRSPGSEKLAGIMTERPANGRGCCNPVDSLPSLQISRTDGRTRRKFPATTGTIPVFGETPETGFDRRYVVELVRPGEFLTCRGGIPGECRNGR